MNIRFFAALLIAGCAGPASAQVYKCPDGAGRTVIQQVPCVGGQTMTVRPASGYTSPSTDADAQARLAKLKRDNEMAGAIRTGEPLVGMTTAQLQQAMGAPSQVNANNYSGVQKNQVIYNKPNATWYVYTTDGVVDSIQRREPTPDATASARPRERCPTPQEIRDAETSASSITISEEQKRGLWRKVEDMRNCGKR